MSSWNCFNCDLYNSTDRFTCQACFRYSHPDLECLLSSDLLICIMEYLDHLSIISFHRTNLSSKLNYTIASSLIIKKLNKLNGTYPETFGAQFDIEIDISFQAISIDNLKETFYNMYLSTHNKWPNAETINCTKWVDEYDWNIDRYDGLFDYDEVQQNCLRFIQCNNVNAINFNCNDYGYQLKQVLKWLIDQQKNIDSLNIFVMDSDWKYHYGYAAADGSRECEKRQSICFVMNGDFSHTILLKYGTYTYDMVYAKKHIQALFI
eukprot:554364_1